MTTQSASLRNSIKVSQRYVWPGGYPIFGLTDDGEALCPDCCSTERVMIASTSGRDGWCIVATDINYDNPDLHCAHCGARIESAYAETID